VFVGLVELVNWLAVKINYGREGKPMNTIDVKGPGIISLSSISKEEDLKPRPEPKINAISFEIECDWCGGYLSELKPFGPPGNRFEDVLIFRLWRTEIRPDEENAKIWEEFFGNCSDNQEAWKRLINRYGEDEARQISMTSQLS
jgi:hypothetical protein